MKKLYFLLPFVLLGCKPSTSTVSDKSSTATSKSIEITYKVQEKEVSDFLKYLSSDEFKVMDIPHMTAFIQEFLPAVTKMADTPTEEITMK